MLRLTNGPCAHGKDPRQSGSFVRRRAHRIWQSNPTCGAVCKPRGAQRHRVYIYVLVRRVRGALIRAESKRHKHLLLKQPIGGNRCQTSKTRMMCARLEIRTGRLAPVGRAQCERNAGLLARQRETLPGCAAPFYVSLGSLNNNAWGPQANEAEQAKTRVRGDRCIASQRKRARGTPTDV